MVYCCPSPIQVWMMALIATGERDNIHTTSATPQQHGEQFRIARYLS